jgi:ATP phosphoribosyltransferase-like protein
VIQNIVAQCPNPYVQEANGLTQSHICLKGVFVANKRALLERKEVLDVAHELLERFEAHLTAQGQFTVVANMRGSSAEEVAERILEHTDFPGLQGPTISPVYTTKNGNISVDYYAIVICVPKPKLYHAIRQLRKVHSSWPFQFDRFPCAVLNVMKHKLISNHYCTDCCSF